MREKLTQPKVRRYRSWLSQDNRMGSKSYIYDETSRTLLDELFEFLKQVAPTQEDGARTLWFHADRGSIEDYGDADELIEDGEFDSKEEFIQTWEEEYPDEVEWYEFTAVELEDSGYRAIALGHCLVLVQANEREAWNCQVDTSEFVQWLLDSLKECIAMLQKGTYNEYVRENLPPQHRVGTICRRDFWNVWPESRADFFRNISKEDAEEFIRLARSQVKDHEAFSGRLPSMTAGDFYRFCSLGYAENRYPIDGMTAREQYYRFADGRDDGLRDINEDSSEAFYKWITNRRLRSGHPWEVCRGGNSTHVSLLVAEDERGYWLRLSGRAVNRTIETVKFFLALHRAGVPVYLADANALADRLSETELIGIVPEDVIPAYCDSYFPGQDIIAFMNLPYEDREKFVPFCTWQPIPEVRLEGNTNARNTNH